MPTNVLNVVVTGRILEKRYNLPSRQAFAYALLPTGLNLGTIESMVLSLAIGRRNAEPDDGAAAPPATRTPVAGGDGQPAEPAAFDLPDLRGIKVADARKRLESRGVKLDSGKATDSSVIADHDPAPGTPVQAGSVVTVTKWQ